MKGLVLTHAPARRHEFHGTHQGVTIRKTSPTDLCLTLTLKKGTKYAVTIALLKNEALEIARHLTELAGEIDYSTRTPTPAA